MSYYQQPPPGGYPPPHQQSYSPQPGYNQPPHSQYPPHQSHSPYPQQGYNRPPPPPPPQMSHHHYPPQGGYPPQGYPPQQYGAPAYPPPQQAFGGPPPQGYPPPQQQWSAPPNQYPPQQHGYGPPPGQYGAPPPQQGYGAPPPGQYGAPPVQHYSGPPAPPSLGYAPQLPFVDTTADAEALRKAMKGFGTDEKTLIRVLSRLDPVQMHSVRQTYGQRFMKDLMRDLEKETSGDFKNTLLAVTRGPLENDCHVLYSAMKGIGTKESDLNDVLCARSNADIHAIKAQYRKMYGHDLDADLRGDLSAGTETLFLMLSAGTRHEESTPVLPHQIEQATTELQNALGSGLGINKNAVHVCQVLTSHSDAELRAISETYQRRYHETLLKAINAHFSGHMKDALHLMVARALNRPMSDAEMLEDAMAGAGTHDRHLIDRVVRIHWDRNYKEAVKHAYRAKTGKDLRKRIEGETRGDYERLLLAMID